MSLVLRRADRRLERALIESLATPAHTDKLQPIRDEAQAVLARFFRRQKTILLKHIDGHLRVLGDNNKNLTEADAESKHAVSTVLPEGYQLPLALANGMQADYAAAVTAALESGYDLLAAEYAADTELSDDAVEEYLREHSLKKLTGNFAETTVERLRNALADAYEGGAGYEGLLDAVREEYEGFSTVRAGMIAQTEMNSAYNSGRKNLGLDLGFNEKSWSPDAGACPECKSNVLAGWIGMDETFPTGDDAPAAHPNCFIGDTAISAVGVQAVTSRMFEGEVIVIRVPGIEDISVTPNHPILTRRGWVAAGEIETSDDLVECIDPRIALSLLDPDNDHVEARIKDVARSLLMTRGVTLSAVPVSAKAFHGDAGVDGKVNVIRPTGSMTSHQGAWHRSVDLGEDASLGIAHGGRIHLDADSAMAKILEAAGHAPDGRLSGRRLGAALAFGHSRGATDLRFGSIALPKAGAPPRIQNGGSGKSRSEGDCKQALARHVRFVKPSSLIRAYFRGHVYNLQTASGIYSANRIVAHNCDCSLDVRFNADA